LDKNDVEVKFTAINNDLIWNEFEAIMNKLKNINDMLKKSDSPLLVRIKDCLSKGQQLNAIVLSYGLLSILSSIIGVPPTSSTGEVSRKEANGRHAAALAFDHWDFGRKLREIYRNFGASEQESWRVTDIVKAVLSRAGNVAKIKWTRSDGSSDPAEFAALIIEENYIDEDFRRILGINFFDDVAWFNKEGFEDALFYSSLFFMMDGSVDIPIEERINRITKIYDVLNKAEEKSGYRFDNLLDILTTKPKSKEKKK